MSRSKTILFITAGACIRTIGAFAADREIEITGKYLNFPVAQEAENGGRIYMPCRLRADDDNKSLYRTRNWKE